MKLFKLTVAACLLPLPLLAQELDYWGEAGGWDVMIDSSLGDGCLIQAAYGDGSVVRIGFDRNQGNGYVTAFNQAWEGIEEGVTYPIAFDLDSQEYEGEATGIYLNDVPGADIAFSNPDFLFDLAQKYTMTLYNEYGEVMAIDLEGSYAGLEAAIACQEEMG
ncbi:MAG: hypothetical protein BM558_12135 [Roseobacter sp. MedPE-SW]|nr:MAG: hypothetical protein BM558_12135 [Roseobacter sp. MedPE-SW]